MTASEIEPPRSMQNLPRNKVGYLVPWFVSHPEGEEPDFRVVKYNAIPEAWLHDLCWICGVRMTSQYRAFVVGPMCSVNQVSAEPPSHLDCAVYAARVCPFLANPGMVRRERGLPEDKVDPAGFMIPDNPGVALVYVSKRKDIEPFQVPAGPGMNPGVLFDMGMASSVGWFAHGRTATRQEVLAAIDKGLPKLAGPAEKEGGVGALHELANAVQVARLLMPA